MTGSGKDCTPKLFIARTRLIVTSLMHREIIITKDGSHSIALPEQHVTYHSIHGAVQESLHVFMEAGFHHARTLFPKGPIHILEVGLGTGLNAWLTLEASRQEQRSVHYTALELFPLTVAEVSGLNYLSVMHRSDNTADFMRFHTAEWEKDIPISPSFIFHKKQVSLLDYSSPPAFHLIYFDAFAPGAQPELWTTEVFENLRSAMHPAAILVTYCSKGDVRRSMEAAGLTVEKIPGPPGKREMVRAHLN